MLIVGCGCRGLTLVRGLRQDGLSVRGTTRDPARVKEIEAAGAEGVVADPDRLATLVPHLTGVAVICWLMGGAVGGSSAAVNGPRLATLLERIVDTPVRGVVYEAAGAAGPEVLEGGARLVAEAADRWLLPVAVVRAGEDGWLEAMRAAVGRVLA